MAFQTFQSLLEHIQKGGAVKRCAVVGAEAIHALEALKEAAALGIAEPVLFGDRDAVTASLRTIGEDPDQYVIHHCRDYVEAAEQAIKAVHAGEADFILKGQVETAVLMRELLKKESDLRTGSVVHAVFFAEIETHHKLLAMTDGAIVIAPTLEQKREMVENTVRVMRKIGWEMPKVAVLTVVEKVNPKIPASVDGAELKRLNAAGEISGCIVEGPISLDLAIDSESAQLKKFNSPVAGDADLLVFPEINTGNVAMKLLSVTGHNKTGIVVLGLKVPVVTSSRGDSAANRLRSILLAAAMA